SQILPPRKTPIEKSPRKAKTPHKSNKADSSAVSLASRFIWMRNHRTRRPSSGLIRYHLTRQPRRQPRIKRYRHFTKSD
ncbi:MAG: hypothetical protein WCK35_28985, partial [Chloroflexota bacterium]